MIGFGQRLCDLPILRIRVLGSDAVVNAAQDGAVAVAELRGAGVPLQRGDKGVGEIGAPLQRLLRNSSIR
jgi:hypothetical protein